MFIYLFIYLRVYFLVILMLHVQRSTQRVHLRMRYTDFYMLHQQLLQCPQAVSLPSFPPKQVFGM